MAETSFKSYKRVSGLILGESRNRPWVIAPCRSYKTLIKVIKDWEKELINLGSMPQDVDRKARILTCSIKIWAQGRELDETYTDKENIQKGEKDVQDNRETAVVEEQRIKEFVRGVFSAGIGVHVVQKLRCCPVCLYHELSSVSISDINSDGESDDSWDLATKKSKDLSSNGWVEMMARLHNKEMHSKNGNIMEKLWDEDNPTREHSAGMDIQRGLYKEPKLSVSDFSYCDYPDGRTYESAGTLHQLADGEIRARWERGAGNVTGNPEEEADLTSSDRRYNPREQYRRPEDQVEDIGDKTLWFGVRTCLSAPRGETHGKLILTDKGEKILRKMNDPKTKYASFYKTDWDSIEDLIAEHYVTIARELVQAVNLKHSDWRVLGLRVCLYDDLKERRFTQPSGNDIQVAARNEPLLEFIPTGGDPKWGFFAVCLNWRYFNTFLKPNGTIPVGPNQEEHWYLNSDEVIVIALSGASFGQDIWVLSHLDYPLVYGLEIFDMVTAGDKNGWARERVPYIRTSSLIDIHSSARYIVFVLMTDYSIRDYNIGGVDFKLSVEQEGEYRAGIGSQIYEFDAGINNMLMRSLNSNVCLRAAFDNYAGEYFVNGIDWMEVDNLAAILKVRWHPKMSVEVRTDAGGHNRRYYQFIDQRTGVQMGIIDGGNIQVPLIDGGSRDAVSTIDQVPLSRTKARCFPHLFLGSWDFLAEFGIVSGVAVYDTRDAGNRTAVHNRIGSGGQDSLMRCGYWRRAIENWKRKNGLRDEIVAPTAYNLKDHWIKYVDKKDGTLPTIISPLCKSNYNVWNWSSNSYRTIRPTTTGIRTPSSWWACPLNTDPIAFSMMCGINHQSNAYVFDTCRAQWSYNCFIPKDEGEDDYQLESVLGRVNLEENIDGIDYMGLPNGERTPGYGYNVAGFFSSLLFREAGWRGSFYSNHLKSKRWGWGLSVVINDMQNYTLKKIVISAKLASIISTNYLPEHSELFRCSDIHPLSSLNDLLVTDMSYIEKHFNQLRLAKAAYRGSDKDIREGGGATGLERGSTSRIDNTSVPDTTENESH